MAFLCGMDPVGARGVQAVLAGAALSGVLALSAPADAEALIATRLVRATEVLGPEDVTRSAAHVPGAATDPVQVLGLEARVALYPGRAVLLSDLAPAAVVERNQVVRLVYRRGGLLIMAEGRALGRAALGDGLRVMNLSSRSTVTGTVTSDGTVEVFGN